MNQWREQINPLSRFCLLTLLGMAIFGPGSMTYARSSTIPCPNEKEFRFATRKDCEGVCSSVFKILRSTSRTAKESWQCKDYAGHISLGDVMTQAEKPKLNYWQCNLQTNACSGKQKEYAPISVAKTTISHLNWAELSKTKCPPREENKFTSHEQCQESCENWYRIFRNPKSHNTSANVGSYMCTDQSPGRSLVQVLQGVKQVDYGFWRCHLKTPGCNTIQYPQNESTENISNHGVNHTKQRDMNLNPKTNSEKKVDSQNAH